MHFVKKQNNCYFVKDIDHAQFKSGLDEIRSLYNSTLIRHILILIVTINVQWSHIHKTGTTMSFEMLPNVLLKSY